MKQFAFTFAVLALAFVANAAERYNVTLSVPSEFGGQILKPGEYKLELKEDRVILKGDKGTVEAMAKIENEAAAKKFSANSIKYSNPQDNASIEEIRIGGTRTRVVLSRPQAAGNE